MPCASRPACSGLASVRSTPFFTVGAVSWGEWSDRIDLPGITNRSLRVDRGCYKENVTTQGQTEVTPLASVQWSIRVVARPERDGVKRS